MPRRTIRLSADANERPQSAVKIRGYANPSAFLRAARDHGLKDREETMLWAEDRLATSMDQISRERSPGSGEHSKPCSHWWSHLNALIYVVGIGRVVRSLACLPPHKLIGAYCIVLQPQPSL
jgi:hypothetical protein